MQKWLPEPDAHVQRRLGKTCEEAGEYVAVLARASIQGLAEIDPSSGKTNRQRFVEEMADVYAQIIVNHKVILTPEERDEFMIRAQKKEMQMAQWESHYK